MDTVLSWRKASYSAGQGNCVEVAALPDGGRLVRDTKDRDGGAVHFTVTQWRRFTDDIKRS